MKLQAGVVILSLALSACGQVSSKQTLIDACMSTGDDSREGCACLADKLEADLAPNVFEILTAAARAESEEAAATLIEELGPLEQLSLGVTMLDAAATCDASIF